RHGEGPLVDRSSVRTPDGDGEAGQYEGKPQPGAREGGEKGSRGGVHDKLECIPGRRERPESHATTEALGQNDDRRTVLRGHLISTLRCAAVTEIRVPSSRTASGDVRSDARLHGRGVRRMREVR